MSVRLGIMGAMTDPAPAVDDRHPADVITGMVNDVLELAATRPRPKLSHERLDAAEGDAWTLRQVAFHVAESGFYADSVGVL